MALYPAREQLLGRDWQRRADAHAGGVVDHPIAIRAATPATASWPDDTRGCTSFGDCSNPCHGHPIHVRVPRSERNWRHRPGNHHWATFRSHGTGAYIFTDGTTHRAINSAGTASVMNTIGPSSDMGSFRTVHSCGQRSHSNGDGCASARFIPLERWRCARGVGSPRGPR